MKKQKKIHIFLLKFISYFARNSITHKKTQLITNLITFKQLLISMSQFQQFDSFLTILFCYYQRHLSKMLRTARSQSIHYYFLSYYTNTVHK